MDTRIEQQPVESVAEHLRRTETNLKQTMAHFRALRRAAFAGRYDPDEFDQAVLACRAAEAELLAARHAVARNVQPPPEGVDPPREPDPLARLRFARWLVETGRLSEQIAA